MPHPHYTTLSPLYRLPNEILEHIFQLFILREANETYDNLEVWDIYESSYAAGFCPGWPDVFALNDGPWLLGRVCSSWRSIVLSSYALWQSFQVRPCQRPFAIDIMSTWISRCGTFPLQVSFAGWESRTNPPFIDMLFSESSRWRTLALSMVSPSSSLWRMILLPSRRDRYECLERIVLVSEESGYLFDIGIYYVFDNAPKLCSVINNSDYIIGTLPWGRLTEYQGFGHLPFTHHVSVLRHSQNLERCCLVIQYDLLNDLSLGTPLILRQLTQLSTKWHSYSSGISGLLRNLRLPALKRLSILGGKHYTFDSVFVDLSYLLQSSDCQLKTLELSGSVVNRENLSELLASAPTITYLRLWVMQVPMPIHNSALALLNTKEKAHILLRDLTTLEFCLPEPSDLSAIDLMALTELVRWRWSNFPVESHIQRLYIAHWKPFVSDERRTRSLPPLLETLNEEGLQVMVCSCKEGAWDRC
ncbi:hypothetical protein VNI00_009543 [Paramarasmius palmivorus]|uniref:F-box domain-containing protein n=1 Tax=Paramarasmius palmivorus TaxID=297713 RepID=A0AAW0CRY2_9AGAR